MLHPLERFRFDLHGYFVRRGAVAPALVERLREALARYEGHTPERLPRGCVPSWTPVLNEYRLMGLLELEPVFHELIDHPQFLAAADDLVPGPYRLAETYSITRLAGVGLPLHAQQEARPGGMDGSEKTHLLKVALALTDVGPDDGPMVLFEGSHRLSGRFPFSRLHPDWEYPSHDRATLDAYRAADAGRLEERWEDIPGYRELHVRAGDVVFFCDSVWHGAKALRSGKRRRTLYCGYVPFHYPNWHGIAYSDELLRSVSAKQRRLLAGPFIGTRYACHESATSLEGLPFPELPNSELGAARFVTNGGGDAKAPLEKSDLASALERLAEPRAGEAAAEVRGAVRLVVAGAAGGVFSLNADGEGSGWIAGELPDADCTLEATEADLLAVAAGEEDAVRLFYAGRLRVHGDVQLAMRLVDRWSSTRVAD